MIDTALSTLPHEVVVNDEEQFSIWPAHRERPAGWHAVGVTGTREECLRWIEANWTDMRPRSTRDRA
ncbi:MbtH family protein [Microvirga calopogonii]|uniref:MbtH family protein n=1 Tax=Microvirga calopogonii TaxID=2078013 RepID=UPI000E0DAF60|nr:MbtH family NRPS accessory protein [Microvirga calopogonii]